MVVKAAPWWTGADLSGAHRWNTRSAWRAQTFKDGFDFVVVRTAVENLGMQIGPGVVHEAGKEIFKQLGLQITDVNDIDLLIIDERGRPPRSTATRASVSSIGCTK